MTFDMTVNGRDYRVELEQDAAGQWKGRINQQDVDVNASSTREGVVSLLIGGQSYEVIANPAQQQFAIRGERYAVELKDPRSLRARRARAGGEQGPKKIVAPMPGKVVRIVADAGSEVEHGAGIVVIEAMKMQNELKSPKKGKVAKVLASVGAAVNAGDVLAIIE